MNINEKIDGKLVVLNILYEGIMYYITADKAIYTKEGQKHIEVQDNVTVKKIIDYITPKSLDIIE